MPQPPTTDSPTRAVSNLVATFVQDLKALWWQSEGHMPDLGPTYTDPEQAAREAHLDRFLDLLSREVKRRPRSQAEFSEVQCRILAGFETFARSALDFEDRHVNVLLSPEFTQAVTEFVQAAYRFDPHITPEAIFQASRNAWVMHGLQILLGLPVQLTPAILAYSLLYPYSDNYLDDPEVSPETKKAFNRRFARRLAGERAALFSLPLFPAERTPPKARPPTGRADQAAGGGPTL